MHEMLIGFVLTIAVVAVVGMIFITREKLKYKVKENVIDRKIHIRCPSCSGDIEDILENEARNGKIEVFVKHNCGSTSTWDAHAWPPVLKSKFGGHQQTKQKTSSAS
ncbi:MAG: hypothetical protein BroJett040_11950 [Oligoflexia bacterium]|nr:MAG: hypothetical protein BroJett040_11950 [Oligoflexia bacterium]